MTLMDAETARSLLNFAEEGGPGLRGLEANALLQQLEKKYGDMKLAMWWFIERGYATEVFRLASSLVPFWMATKRLDEGSDWFDLVLGVPGGDDVHRGRAAFEAGYLAFWRGDYERSLSLQNRAVELGRQTSNSTVTALALVGLARIALRTNVEEARRLCHEALAVTDGTTDQVGRSSAMHVLAVTAQMAGDLPTASQLMSQRIALAREMGNFATISIESNNLSMVKRQLGNIDEAEALSCEALEISYKRGDSSAIPWNLNGLAATAAAQCEFDRAAMLIGAADAAMQASGGAWPPDELAHYERTVTQLTDQMGAAEFERQRAAGYAISTCQAVEFALSVNCI